jgi:hypothetical protein
MFDRKSPEASNAMEKPSVGNVFSKFINKLFITVRMVYFVNGFYLFERKMNHFFILYLLIPKYN